MIYDLSKDIEIEKIKSKLTFLIKRGCMANLSEKRKKRTIKQNAYLHALFSLFGLNFGYTIDEAKDLIKRDLKYIYEKKGRIFLIKTSQMNTKELTIFIEKFRNFSNTKGGYYLPSADEYLTNYAEFERQIINNEIYL